MIEPLETDWDANRNEYGSALYDMSHQLEQFHREDRAWAWVRNVAAVVLAFALTMLYWTYPAK